MIFKTSRLKALVLFLGSAGFVTAFWYALFEAGEIGDFERAVFWVALVFFGLGGLVVLVKLFARSEVIEITENGFTYSAYPNQFIQWKDIDKIAPIGLPQSIGFTFKNKHHPVLYQQAARGWFSSKKPKKSLQISISMFSGYREMSSAFLHAFAGEIMERVDEELEDIYSKKVEDIAEQVNMNPDDVRDYVEQLTEPSDPESVISALSVVAEPEPEVAKATTPVAVEGEEWWQSASREFGERVATQQRDRQRYGASKRRS